MLKRIKPEIALTLFLFLSLLFVSFQFNTTGDAGDSVLHFLYSKYAFKHPEFFFNHWAKPLFVALSAPFAQFGFQGMIVFNVLCVCLTSLFTFYIARLLKIKNALLVFLIAVCCPLYFKLIFSGLTEYLFALFLTLGIYFWLSKKQVHSLIILSFLPLIRSEGLIVLCVFAGFLILIKEYKKVGLLFFGQVLYSIVGAFFYKDLFWVFSEIPYLNTGSPYGHGQLTDFIYRLNYTIEKPIYFVLIIGALKICYDYVRQGIKNTNSPLFFLVLGTFVVFFVAHSVFWWLGMVNSMGLPRVLNAVIPLIALMALIGFNTLQNIGKQNWQKTGILVLFVAVIIVFPFTPRKEGVVFREKEFRVIENNLIHEEVIPFLNHSFENKKSQFWYYSIPYIAMELDMDYFDIRKHSEIHNIKTSNIPVNAVVIWDDWNSVIGDGIALSDLTSNPELKLIRSFFRKENERLITFKVFIKE